jgi:hypothetical protein
VPSVLIVLWDHTLWRSFIDSLWCATLWPLFSSKLGKHVRVNFHKHDQFIFRVTLNRFILSTSPAFPVLSPVLCSMASVWTHMDRPGALEVDHRGGTPLMPRASHHHRTHLAHQVGFSLADSTGTLQKHYKRKNIQRVGKKTKKIIQHWKWETWTILLWVVSLRISGLTYWVLPNADLHQGSWFTTSRFVA